MGKRSVVAIIGGLSIAILAVALFWAASFLFEHYRQYQRNEQIAQIERAEDDALKLAVRSARAAVANLEKIKEEKQKDDPGAKPDAHDPATKIDRVTAFFKSDPRYKFFKYEIWAGEYQKQKVWTIDYYYSERGLDGVFVLKHVISYFRQGKIIANSDPISVDEENAKPKDEGGASRTAVGAWKDLSHSTQDEVESAAAEDAQYAWRKLHLRQGSDGQFNWFEIGMKEGDAKGVFHERHVLVEGPTQKAYDKKFEETFTAIAQKIEAKDAL